MEQKEELTDLLNRIEKWSADLGLNVNSTPREQVMKFFEELGELSKALQTKNVLEIMDGIGDSVVVGAVMATQLRKFSVNEKYDTMPLTGIGNEYSGVYPIHPIEDMSRLFYVLTQDIQRFNNYCNDAFLQEEHGHYLFKFYGKVLRSLHLLANCIGVDFNKCVKMAYATIHFRSGEIVDGVFVKRKPEQTIMVSTKKLALSIDDLIAEVVECAKQADVKFFKVEFELAVDGAFEPTNGVWTREV